MKRTFQEWLEAIEAFFNRVAESIIDASGLNYEEDSLLDKTTVFKRRE